MVPKAETISSSVTGLVPKAKDGTASSSLLLMPIWRAINATRAGPISSMSCTVIVFFEYASASASVNCAPEPRLPLFVTRQVLPPPRFTAIDSSVKRSSGEKPRCKAAAYTNGLNVEPGWRCATATWSYSSTAKSRLPTHTRTLPVEGSTATKPASRRVAVARRASIKRSFSRRARMASSSDWPPSTIALNSPERRMWRSTTRECVRQK